MKRRKRYVFIWSFLFVFLVGVGAATGYAAYLTDQVKQTALNSHQGLDRGEKSDKRTKEVTPAKDHTSVLFVGIDDSDKRESSPSRSDALVLATFNEDDKSIKMLNIPRDSLTYIPEVGYEDKIAHAHAFGGIDGTVETVERMLDVPVDYYVRLNFNSFVEIVDSIGGITYDVPFDMQEQNSSDQAGAIELTEGKQLINGEEALALARTRKYDSDLARGERQMEIIQQIFRETVSAKGLNNMDEILSSVSANMKTNLTFSEMIQFKDYFLQKENFTFDKMQLEGEGGFTGHGWYYQLAKDDLTATSDELKNHLELQNPIASENEEENSM
ncbi:LytR family transcriptional regulator [Halobacillus litoralis]|uniref:LytR family transcriptional regulator n=1 Tax=Halobacillus litoralis TaxID=45668 RepID=A0A845F8I9_9BACI|nr:LCP family protein [Halobacillus litoralis]MYL69995.1 LytR family transcriptional regulator [Halobacillus litoralis]